MPARLSVARDAANPVRHARDRSAANGHELAAFGGYSGAMVHLTLAIADFMGILIGAAFWAGVSIGGVVLAGLAVVGGLFWLARRVLRRHT